MFDITVPATLISAPAVYVVSTEDTLNTGYVPVTVVAPPAFNTTV